MKKYLPFIILMLILFSICAAHSEGPIDPYWNQTRDFPVSEIYDYYPTRTRGALSVSVTIPNNIKTGKAVSFKATASGGTAPYTYCFEILQTADDQPDPETDYVSPLLKQRNFESNDTLVWTFYLPQDTYFLKATVKDDNGSTATGVYFFEVAGENLLAQKISQIVSAGPSGNAWEMALYLHDYLTNHAYYDYGYSRYTAEGVLIDGFGVCDSYTKAYKKLCTAAGIRAERVESDIQNHAWNAIQLGGEWYLVDVTWDDPGKSTTPVSGKESHDYFCLNDELMYLDHQYADASFKPDCTALDANYHIHENLWQGFGASSTEWVGNNLVVHNILDDFQAGLDAGEAAITKEWTRIIVDVYADGRFTYRNAKERDYILFTYGMNLKTWALKDGTVIDAVATHERNSNSVTLTANNLPVHEHTLMTDVSIPATCTETGLTEGSHCSVCGEVLVAQEIIPALGHTTVTDEAVPATCTETGLTEGSHCSVCGEVLIAQEIVPALGHTVITNAAVPATCTETGLTESSYCSVCREVLSVQEIIPALGHIEVVDPAIAATCTEAGLTEGRHCSVCNMVLSIQEIVPAVGHTPVTDAAFSPNCTETGLTEGSHCSVCNEILVAQESIPALGHTPVKDEAVVATCIETGLTEGSHCSVCGEVLIKQEIVEKHSNTAIIDAAIPATCTVTGLTEGSHCAVCGAIIKQQEIAPLHSNSYGVMPGSEATCITTGLTEGLYCTVCNEIIIDQKIVPTNENHLPVIDEGWIGTCNTCGMSEGSHCERCGKVLVAQEVLPPRGHIAVIDPPVEATCTTDGLTEGSHCSDCGYILQIQYVILASGHEAGEWETVLEPTYSDTGLRERRCTVCGELLDVEELPIIPRIIKGDLNDDGKVNLKDSMLLLQYLAGWEVDFNEINADVNSDGKVNLKDSMLLLQYLAGWESEYISD